MQKHTKTLLYTTFPPFDHAQTHKNTAIYDLASLRPCKSTQKHGYVRHFLPSTMQKHTKAQLFATFPPLDHANTYKNATIYDMSPHSTMQKRTQKHSYLRHFLPSTMQKHTETQLFTTCAPLEHAKIQKNAAIFDTSPLQPCKHTAKTQLFTTFPPSTMHRHTKTPLFTTPHTYIHTDIHTLHTYVHPYINTFEFAELLRTLLCATSPAP